MDLRDGTVWGVIANNVIEALSAEMGQLESIDLEQVILRLTGAKEEVELAKRQRQMKDRIDYLRTRKEHHD